MMPSSFLGRARVFSMVEECLVFDFIIYYIVRSINPYRRLCLQHLSQCKTSSCSPSQVVSLVYQVDEHKAGGVGGGRGKMVADANPNPAFSLRHPPVAFPWRIHRSIQYCLSHRNPSHSKG